MALEVGADGHATLTSAVIPTQAAEAYLAGELAGPAQSDVTVDCGDLALLIGAVGDALTCEAVRGERDGGRLRRHRRGGRPGRHGPLPSRPPRRRHPDVNVVTRAAIGVATGRGGGNNGRSLRGGVQPP